MQVSSVPESAMPLGVLAGTKRLVCQQEATLNHKMFGDLFPVARCSSTVPAWQVWRLTLNVTLICSHGRVGAQTNMIK
jgi:hypothetical protein